MKNLFYYLSLAVIVLSGCTEKSDENENIVGSRLVLWTCEQLYDQMYLDWWHKAPTHKKEDFVLTVDVVLNKEAYYPSYYDGSEECKEWINWMNDLFDNGMSDIAYNENNHVRYDFLYAGIAGGAKIYADKMMWGRNPGEDLGDMFAIVKNEDDILVSYPDFQVLYRPEDEQPATFSEYTSKGFALNIKPHLFTLSFREIPAEDLDTVTLTVELPVDIEYYEDYTEEMYQTHNIKPEGRRILTGTYTANFDK